ncbi:hypothetical protein [Rhizomicrobium electricum]|uniref:HNH endonuclease n=1 Tax=Rhizomicrobium electricum TaxID=480070 RepID=A0ABP3QET6_9PROT|nr:hypothetical protein [Rhizomicrobium electricum]NIJ50746.1 hypothetical protein [Rhizomicrobium electricum]
MSNEHMRAQELHARLNASPVRGVTFPEPPTRKQVSGGRKAWKVRGVCEVCGETKEYWVDNILFGKTTQCTCSRGVKHGGSKGAKRHNLAAQRWAERYDAILQRCRNPRNPQYADYGGRGIELRFESRTAFVLYMLAEYPDVSPTGLEIDRVNNNGHYEPGNLQLVPCRVNLRNTRRNVLVEYEGLSVVASDLWHLLRTDYPDMTLGRSRTTKLALEGIHWSDIVSRNGRGAYTPGKLDIVDPDIVALYRSPLDPTIH